MFPEQKGKDSTQGCWAILVFNGKAYHGQMTAHIVELEGTWAFLVLEDCLSASVHLTFQVPFLYHDLQAPHNIVMYSSPLTVFT